MSAQDADVGPLPTVADLTARLDRAAATPLADPVAQERLVALLRQALAQVEAAAQAAAQTGESHRLIEEAPSLLAEVRKQLAGQTPPIVVPTASTVALTALEAGLRAAQLTVTAAEQGVAELEAERLRRVDRRTVIPESMSQLRQRLDAPTAPPSEALPELAEAQRLLQRATREATTREIESLEQELRRYELRSELRTARQDLASRQLNEARAVAAQWQEQLNERRRLDTEASAAAARAAVQDAAGAHPVVVALAEANASLSSERQALQARIEETTKQRADVAARAAEIASRQASVQQKVAAAGFTDAVAALLRRHRADLPDPDMIQDMLDRTRRETSAVQLTILDSDEERSSLQVDPIGAVQLRMEEVDDVGEAERGEIERTLTAFLDTRRVELEAYIAELDRYTALLVDLDIDQRGLIQRTGSYAAMIDENVLWVRSARTLAPSDLRDIGRGVAWLLDPGSWRRIGARLANDAGDRPLGIVPGALLLLVLLLSRRRAGHIISEIGRRVATTRVPAFRDTIVVLVLTLWRAALLPGALWIVGTRIAATAAGDPFGQAIGNGLSAAAYAAGLVSLLTRLTRANGLGEVHLRWPPSVVRPLRLRLQLIASLLVPAVAVSVAMQDHPLADVRDALGRVALIAVLLTLTGLTVTVLGERGVGTPVPGREDGWVVRLRPLWWPLVVLLPPGLAVATVLGWDYLGREFATRLLNTWFVVLLLLVAHGVVMRWLFIENRQMRLDLARRRREAAADAASEGEVLDLPLEYDPAEIGIQARQLLRTAVAGLFILSVWLIWADVLPALGALDRITLWTVAGTAAASGPVGMLPGVPPPANAVPAALGALQAVTLADLLLGVLVFALTVVASRNGPGLLEITVLRRLTLQPGSGYAITTVVRYAIFLVGLSLAAAQIGVSWDKVQWLAAAITVGLGFGLQEIFANFVSGLIILFERPVRVGDIVTVGTVEGVVTKIRIRATTIRDWDRRELLVPNREFITGQLINWTLTDPITRIVVPVGVAYGSDTRLVTQLLLDAARRNPLVLTDPSPSVVFRGFGDSALDFQLRVFLGNRDLWPVVTHDLNTAIDDGLRAAGIQIPFPQRDVHVRTFGAALPVEARGAAARDLPPDAAPS